MAIWKIMTDSGARVALGSVEEGPSSLLPRDVTIDLILERGAQSVEHLKGVDAALSDCVIMAPIGSQEVWAAGVTYVRSKVARLEESSEADYYDLVYEADRPELFFKANGHRVRGPGSPVGIRFDSEWNVPEPELGLVIDSHGSLVGYVVSNDMSSRSIEGQNPLYLPQAKCYAGSCALGPCIVPVDEAPPLQDLEITLDVKTSGGIHYSDSARVSQMARSPAELIEWLMRAMDFPRGAVLLTGTPIVPGSDFSLQAGDQVAISITGLGRLDNPVEVTGPYRPHPAAVSTTG